MNTKVIIQFIYELCGLLLIVFGILAFITSFWQLFITAVFFAFALVAFIIRRIFEWRYGELWKNSLKKLFAEDE
jgi:uncharacterized membrane protein HdeD (DUF308 family)